MADHWFWAAVRILGKNSCVKIELSVLELGCGLTVRNWRNGHWFCRRHSASSLRRIGREGKKTSWCRRSCHRLRESTSISSCRLFTDRIVTCRSSIRWTSSTSACWTENFVVWCMSIVNPVQRTPRNDYRRLLLKSQASFLYVTVTLTGDFDCIISLWLTVFFPLFIYQLFCTVRFNGEDLISIVNIDCFNILYFWISQSLLS